MKIRYSILVLLLIVIAGLAVISFFGTNMIKDEVNEIVDRENPKVQAAMEMEININEMTQSILEILEQEEQHKTFTDDAEDFKIFSAQYKSLIRTDEELQYIIELDTLFEQYESIGLELIETQTQQISKIQERRDLLNGSIENILDDELQQSTNFGADSVNKKFQALNEMEINIHELISASRGYLLKPDAFLKVRVADSMDDYRFFEKQYSQSILNPSESKHFETLKINFNTAESLTFEILDLEDRKITEQQKFDDLSIEMDNVLDEHIQKIALEKIHEDEQNALDVINNFIIGLSVVFIIMLIASFTYSSKVGKRIENLVNITSEVQKGNYDVRVNDIKTDEIGFLGKSLNDTISKLQAVTKQKDEFASMITHELKTPLVPILGFCTILKDPSGGKLDELQRDSVEEIEKNANELLNLIQNMLNVQKIELMQLKFNLENIDVNKLMNERYKNLENLMKEKNIAFVNSTESGLTIKGDAGKINEIFSNLVLNAVDFVPEGGRIEISAKDDGDMVLFYVKDNGLGISKENISKMFQKFYQADTSQTRKHGGSGLGLAICKGFIEGMDGKIWIESEEGKGTTFFFTIPKADD